MGNCCSSKKAEHEFDDDLNTLKPGEGCDPIEGGNEGQNVDLDDLVADKGAAAAPKPPGGHPEMTAEERKKYDAELAIKKARHAKLEL